MHNFLQSLFICLFLKWIKSNGSSLPKDLNTLKIGDMPVYWANCFYCYSQRL